jgi:hypothetical protein
MDVRLPSSSFAIFTWPHPRSCADSPIEAEAAARLEHPQIVRIHEIGECEGHPFFSMDLVQGALNARIARGDLATAEEIARLMATVARAAHHAHGRGVLHRDLKPGNILIDSAGQPHLTDFGLAKILQHNFDEESLVTLTKAGVPGTPSYMSPEQVSGGGVSRASDIYGLGAVLYALMTGRPPFQGATPLDLFKQIVEQQPVRPRSVNRSLPFDLETICLKCLEKDPRRRYVTAEALAEDLESFAAGGRIKARPPTVIHRSRRWIHGNPVGAAFMASLCLGLFVALALLKVVNDQRREMELDQDQTFDEGMQKVSQIWRDPGTKAVTVSGRELAILAGRSPADSRGAKYQLTLGVSADDGAIGKSSREGVIFARTNAGIHQLANVAGKSLALPDPDLSLTVWAKERLVESGLRGTDCDALTNIVDRGVEVGPSILSACVLTDCSRPLPA